MASCYGHANHDAAKREQIVTEFFAKSLHIILEARSPFMPSRNFRGETISSPASSSSSHRPRDKWFNLALCECPAELENIDFWQHCNLKPMVVDVVLIRRSLDHEPRKFYPSSKDREERRHEKVIESVIERWVVLYENQKGKDSASSSKRSATSLTVFYKKLLVLLRSLYSTARFLPANKLFRDRISSGRLRAATLTHRLRSFINPCIGGEEANMQRFRFTPVDSFSGRLSVYVSYKSCLPDLPLEPSTPESPQIIPDYVGSPLADLFKSFPSFPSYSPITSNNSGNTDIFCGSPAPLTHVSGTQHPPPTSLPCRFPDTSQTKYRIVGFDEKPSPTHFPHAKSPKELPQSDCASGRVRSTQQACTGTPPSSPSIPGVLRDKISGASGPMAEKRSVQKVEIGRASRTKLSFDSSPRALFSRSSSGLDYDNSGFDCPFALDEDDMIDPGGRVQKREKGEPFETSGKPALVTRSQDAAVGALLLMLNSAPPLQLDLISGFTNCSPASLPKGSSNRGQSLHQMSKEAPRHITGTSSSFVCTGQAMPKTVAHALNEIRGFRDMRESLQKCSCPPRYALDKV